MTSFVMLWLQISLAGASMAAVILGLRALFGQRVSPRLWSALWLLVLLRLCLPVTLESPVQLTGLQPATPEVQTVLPAQPSSDTAESLSPAVDTNPVLSSDIPASVEPSARTASAVELDRSYWLAVLWLAGAAVVLCHAALKAALFHRRFIRTAALADGDITAIVDRHRQALRVQRRITVRVSPQLTAPVVFGWLKPCILLPQSLAETMSADRLAYVLLHEVYHVRRGDILLSHVWLLAKAAHWFNPLVWLAHRAMTDDIELRCDQLVSSRLSENEQLEYTQSLIDVFRTMKRHEAFPASASLCGRRSHLDRRVRRMLAPVRRSMPALAVTALLALVMAAAVFTSACGMTANLSGASVPSLGEVWKEDIPMDDGSVLARVDAAVSMPDTDEFPIAAVFAAPFNQHQITQLASHFSEGAGLIFSDTPTSAELEERIAKCNAALESGDYGSQTAASLRDMIDESEMLLAMKPQIEVPTDSSLKPNPMHAGGYLHAVVSANRSGEITAAVSDDASFFSYNTIDDNDMLMPLADSAPASPGLKLTGEQAVQQAKKLLTALSSSYEVISVQRGKARDLWGNDEQGWIVKCAQTAYDIPIRYAVMKATGQTDSINRLLNSGDISLHYDDNGLRAFLWTNPLQAGDVKNSSARLMDFDEIKNLFAKNAKEIYADKLPARGLALRVTGVELAYATMPQDDGAFALIPAWIFSGGFEDAQGNIYTADTYEPALMALSATDGTLLGSSYFE